MRNPKRHGKDGQYEVTVPTVTDRVVQASLKLVLEPVFEADFQPFSYGFRPGRRQHDAIAEIHHFATRGYEWVLEADIKACFDEIGHVPLMDRLRVRIKDKRILALVKAFLKAGIMTPDGEEESHSGTPAGGILSPLLANIALSALDDHFAGQWQQLMKTSWQRQARRERGLGNRKMIRFADDFVVMVAGERRHAEALREEVSGVLATLGLRLAPEKTRVVHIDEGFDFLSITIRRMRKRGTSRHYVYTKPSRKAIQAVKDKVAAKTYRSTQHQEPAVLIQGISQTLRGWANYHRHGVSKAVFSAVDSHAWNRIMRWLRRKYQGRTGLGMPELRRRFCVPGTWKFAHNGVIFTGASTVPVVRYRYRGTRIPSPYPQPSAGPSG
jgi:RNA-directed DNA polymerase